MATIADRGRTRKEYFRPRAFRFAVEDPTSEINLLVGHDFDKPLASKQARTFDLVDEDSGLSFRAVLPPLDEQPSWMRDQILAIRSGLTRGASPGFKVPPGNVVRNAERLIPEPGNPGVMIREISDAVLYEMSVVTRAAYKETIVDVRDDGLVMPTHGLAERKARLWL